MRLIDADELKSKNRTGFKVFDEWIDACPTIHLSVVKNIGFLIGAFVRKHTRETYYTCRRCDCKFLTKDPVYCPRCGKKINENLNENIIRQFP